MAGSMEKTPPAGLEPATGGLENRCSIHLSYEGKINPNNDWWQFRAARKS